MSSRVFWTVIGHVWGRTTGASWQRPSGVPGGKTRANRLCVSLVGGSDLPTLAGNPGWRGGCSLPGQKKASIRPHFLPMCSSENPRHHFFLPAYTLLVVDLGPV